MGVRTFELDVFADPAGGTFSRPLLNRLLNLGLPRPAGVDAPGMKVLHIQDIDYRSTCPTLIGCLERAQGLVRRDTRATSRSSSTSS